MHLNKTIFFFFIIIIYLISINLTGCEKKNKSTNNIIAIIENKDTITFKNLKKFVYDGFYDRIYKDRYEAYNKALEVMITNRVKCIDFFEKGLNENYDLIQGIQRIINEELIVEYFESQFLSKYTNDEFALDTYKNKIGRQVSYRQIVLYKPENTSPEQLKSIREKALDIKEQIEAGKDMGILISQYSQHKESINSDGYMTPIGWEQSLSNPIENSIFNMKLDDISVLEANDAFHIVKITNINKIHVQPYEKIKEDIIEKLKKNYLNESMSEYEKVKNETIDKKHLKWNEEALNKIIKWSQIPEFYDGIYNDTLKKAIEDKRNYIILTNSTDKIDLKEYLRLLNNILIPKDTKNITKNDLKDFIIEALRTDKMVKKAKELNLGKKIFNSKTNNQILQFQIAYLYDKAMIELKTPAITNEVLHKFYEEQKDSIYYHLHKVNAYVMEFAKKKEAEDAMQKIRDGIPFEKITGRYKVKTYIIDRDGKIKLFRSKEIPVLGEEAIKLKLNESTGPIEYDDPIKGKQYAIIKSADIRPEKQLLYEDVKSSIDQDLIEYYREKVIKENKEALWKKYKIEINEDVLKRRLSLLK
ncbi:MAG: peptidyl-prolyl cis-trans isomerase [Calditrichaceae bacterium]|nr:peptidyl-prolyl cis-trans isomerase [Calditrichaceae bacterium]MBN2708971.1 peptidyl-prolyl cis-trans isomerase [Calditrichaceae bacterium]RQV97507.1 MAG: peptidyl-prolyl cis-trans isomerase [Calditrichota bacterium]